MKQHLALEYLLNTTWAIDQRLLAVMGQLVTRHIDDINVTELNLIKEALPNHQALMAKSGKHLGEGLILRENGVAVLPIYGVISRYTTWFQSICGGTSTQVLAKVLDQALTTSSVKAIVLSIDSPGGQSDGIHELAEILYAARGTKPIVAYVGGTAASAAYWIASAADEIVMDATAMVGSIGVVATLNRYKDREDIERLEFISSQSPKKRLDPASKAGRADWQHQVDQIADIFIERVARNMGVERDKVLADFGQGGVLIGQSAIKQGMAHRLGSLEGVIQQLSKRKAMTQQTNIQQVQGVTLPSVEETNTTDYMAALKAQRPDVLEAITSGLAAAVKPEAMAVESASDLAAACADAGLTELIAQLLQPGITKANAMDQIAMASALKDICAAAGIEQSVDGLIAHLNDPVKLVGQVIHEVQASDESHRIEGQIQVKETQQAKIDGQAIMAKRRANIK